MTNHELTHKILELTREGRVSDWAERISLLASKAGLQLEQINWNSSPLVIASHVVQNARSYYGNTKKLEEILGV